MRLLALYAIPLLIGNLFQFLYTTIDTIIVGQVIGSNALAAVGAAGTPAMLFVGFAIGLSSAFTVKISQFFGEKNEPAIRNALGTQNAGRCKGDEEAL